MIRNAPKINQIQNVKLTSQFNNKTIFDIMRKVDGKPNDKPSIYFIIPSKVSFEPLPKMQEGVNEEHLVKYLRGITPEKNLLSKHNISVDEPTRKYILAISEHFKRETDYLYRLCETTISSPDDSDVFNDPETILNIGDSRKWLVWFVYTDKLCNIFPETKSEELVPIQKFSLIINPVVMYDFDRDSVVFKSLKSILLSEVYHNNDCHVYNIDTNEVIANFNLNDFYSSMNKMTNVMKNLYGVKDELDAGYGYL